jgi:hypothetical protein
VTAEDLYYLPPENEPDETCLHLIDDEQCGLPTGGGPLCDDHPAQTPEEYDAYIEQAA